MENEKLVDVLTEEDINHFEKINTNSYLSYAAGSALISSHRTLNSRNAKLVHENDELMAENEKLRNILIKLHAHMDFAEPIENNEPISYTDASGINAVFEEAFKALEELNHE